MRPVIIVDAFWGSSGKGKIATALADRLGIQNCSAANHPNAGHTVEYQSRKYVFKALPSPSCLPGRKAFICADSVFASEQLLSEIYTCGVSDVAIHERASVSRPDHIEAERLKTYKIASTMQGGCAARTEKMWRSTRPQLQINHPAVRILDGRQHRCELREAIHHGGLIHEVAQGTALSLDHGTSYPTCTYRDCIAASGLEDMGLPPSTDPDVYMAVRTFPIRVGDYNGHSSGPGGIETTWENVLFEADAPDAVTHEVLKRETTTVTKRQRRVFHMDWTWLREACFLNGPRGLIVSFVEYIDWRAFGVLSLNKLPPRVIDFLAQCENETGIPVVGISTGPEHHQMIWRTL